MKEQYTSPEVTLISYVAEEDVTLFDTNINGNNMYDSAAKIDKSEDIPFFFFDWY